MAVRPLTPKEALELVPQREPFRFVDELQALGGERAHGSYRWRPDAAFYRGHFPGDPVTPGVLLVECMAQCGVVPMALYLFHLEGPDRARTLATLFTEANVEFSGIVRPGDHVRVRSERVFYRRRKLRVRAEMALDDGTVVCSGELSGIGVPR
jgi:3-hydroxyacyl-[acyl-carrier-protein] dehydratase